MATTYTYYVNTPPGDIVTRVTNLQTRLNIDLDISQDPTSVTYSGVTQIVYVVYASALTDKEAVIMEFLFETCIAQLTPGNEISPRPTDLLERVSYTANGPPTSQHDIRSKYQPGSFVIDAATNIGYICYKNTFGAAVWKSTGSSTGSINFTFDGNNGTGASTSNSSYSVFCAFYFEGTNNGDNVSNSYAVCYAGGNNFFGQYRLYDVLNAQVIGESVSTSVSTIPYTRMNITSISNLPVGPTYMEL
jgi:hypothetical protein